MPQTILLLIQNDKVWKRYNSEKINQIFFFFFFKSSSDYLLLTTKIISPCFKALAQTFSVIPFSQDFIMSHRLAMHGSIRCITPEQPVWKKKLDCTVQGSILALANLLNAGWFLQKASCKSHHLLILASWKNSLYWLKLWIVAEVFLWRQFAWNV